MKKRKLILTVIFGTFFILSLALAFYFGKEYANKKSNTFAMNIDDETISLHPIKNPSISKFIEEVDENLAKDMDEMQKDVDKSFKNFMKNKGNENDFEISEKDVGNKIEFKIKYSKNISNSNLSVKIQDGMITISGNKEITTNNSKSISSFSKSMNLPMNAKEENAEIKTNNGEIIILFNKAN